MAEVIADYRQHIAGERETVNWTRPDGHTYVNVPVYFLREVTRTMYLTQFPHAQAKLDAEPDRVYFWEVSVD